MALSQYLSRYAEPEVAHLASMPMIKAQHVCVIPCFKETSEFVTRYLKTFPVSPTLLVLVINQPVSCTDYKLQETLSLQVLSQGEALWENENLKLMKVSQHWILIVDRYSQPRLRIPDKQGVGLARKIGADCACYCIARGDVGSNWIYSTDADAYLPASYFEITPNMEQAAGMAFGFQHRTDVGGDVARATDLYEHKLHYYVAGLKFAGSKYAFHTIGSCLAFHEDSYQKVRGFPKKSAGEDFYLLNKLAKLGRIIEHPAIISIDARVSDRVPFGTGPAVADILELFRNNQTYCVYAPECFLDLKYLLDQLRLLCEMPPSEISQWCSVLPTRMETYLEQSGFLSSYSAWRQQGVSQQQLHHQIHGWMDAFRTLKFIHFLRDNGYSDVPLQQAVQGLDDLSKNRAANGNA